MTEEWPKRVRLTYGTLAVVFAAVVCGIWLLFGAPSETKVNPPTAEATPAPAVTPHVATAPEAPAPAPAPETPVPPIVATPPVPEAAAPPVVAAPAAPPVPEAPSAAPPPISPAEKPTSKPVAAGVASAVFPSEISPAHAGEKPIRGSPQNLYRTISCECHDQLQ
jgi:hypothetical protein